ncbi:TRAM domain-containing protein [Psychromonas sp. MME2]|uniref:TRAM domain-containing protein n=1 Tax=Psychromonas sp. MME2 TaxID=3231033 RepID=UPI00339CE37D
MAQFFKAKRTNSAKNHIIKDVHVEKVDHQGRGIAYFKNSPLFIEGGLVGESLDIQIVENKKNYSTGVIKKVNRASVMRVAPTCPHYEECGGCQLQHLAQDNQIAIKLEGLQSLFKRFAKHQPLQLAQPIIDDAWGYRRTARFGVQFDNKSKKLKMGFRRSASNDLIEQRVCPVLVPS